MRVRLKCLVPLNFFDIIRYLSTVMQQNKRCHIIVTVIVSQTEIFYRHFKLNVNPDDLIPKLPKPRDLQPFPTTQALVTHFYAN